MKKGNRVTVKEGVSNCMDTESLRVYGKEGASREHFVGKKGEVVQVGEDGPVPCPDPDMVLVDSRVDGVGMCDMREWFHPDELELG